MKCIKLNEGLDLIERENGFYCVITLPMYAPTTNYLWTRNKEVAIEKANKLYCDMKGVY